MYRTACAYVGNFGKDGRKQKYQLPSQYFGDTLGCDRAYHENPDETKAFYWYRKIALTQFSNEVDLTILGWFYLRGIGTSHDYTKAFHIFMHAARRIDPNLGPHGCYTSEGVASEEMYRLGLGTTKSEKYAKYFQMNARYRCSGTIIQ